MLTELSLPATDLGKRPVNHGAIFSWQLVPFLFLWAIACWGLSSHWTLNPQYQYGWLVPGLALLAGYKRWQTRPAPGAPLRVGLWLAGVGCILLLPSWLFLQPNQHWPLFNWLFVGQIVAILLGVIAAIGGGPWLRYFAFPVALIFTAIPWPDAVESPLMQYLMRTVASVAVAGLELFGITAIQHGNLLEVAGGVVGVDEACSGIRSLQGALMSAIFLGELFRFRIPRRLLLIVVSVVVALVTNVLRVGFLAWSAASSGVAAVDRWHDPTGMVTLGVCVATILMVALALDGEPLAISAPTARVSGSPIPRWFTLGVAGWSVFVILATEFWYFDGARPPENPWAVALPPESKSVRVSPSAQAQLFYDSVTGATWSDAKGKTWLIYFFDWKFGPAFSRVSARLHRPDICLPATGMTLVADRGVIGFGAGGGELPFHAYTFKQGDSLLFVYHGVWPVRSERGNRHGPLSTSKQVASLQSVLWRERRIGQQSAEIAVSGYESAEDADANFARALPSLIVSREHGPSL